MRFRYIIFLLFINTILALFIPENFKEVNNNELIIQNSKIDKNILIFQSNDGNNNIVNNKDNEKIEEPQPSKSFFENFKNLDLNGKLYVLMKIIVCGILGSIFGFFLSPLMLFIALTLLGFTTAGIALGSIAAYIMSLFGGTIAAGSFFSILQSIGALGLYGLFTSGIIPHVGAITGLITSEIILFKYLLF